MKSGFVAIVVLLCAGLMALAIPSSSELDPSPGREVAAVVVRGDSPEARLIGLQGTGAAERSTVEDRSSGASGTAIPQGETLVFGRVVDPSGDPVVSATVYLVGDGAAGTSNGLPANARQTTDRQGSFGFGEAGLPEAFGDDGCTVRLVVTADGYTRRVVAHARREQPAGGWRIQLQAGLELAGRIVDEFGEPVSNMQLLAHTAGAAAAYC